MWKLAISLRLKFVLCVDRKYIHISSPPVLKGRTSYATLIFTLGYIILNTPKVNVISVMYCTCRQQQMVLVSWNETKFYLLDMNLFSPYRSQVRFWTWKLWKLSFTNYKNYKSCKKGIFKCFRIVLNPKNFLRDSLLRHVDGQEVFIILLK